MVQFLRKAATLEITLENTLDKGHLLVLNVEKRLHKVVTWVDIWRMFTGSREKVSHSISGKARLEELNQVNSWSSSGIKRRKVTTQSVIQIWRDPWCLWLAPNSSKSTQISQRVIMKSVSKLHKEKISRVNLLQRYKQSLAGLNKVYTRSRRTRCKSRVTKLKKSTSLQVTEPEYLKAPTHQIRFDE